MTVLDRIDEARERWNVLSHPFYVRWSEGDLTREELAFYAGEYRHAVVALADAAEVAAGADAEHAREEREHVALWDAFAGELGAELDRPPRAETERCAAAWAGAADALEGVAVMYAIEAGQPAISATKLDGLLGRYGFAEGPATEYFSLHAERDREHAAHGRAVLERSAGPEDADRLVAAAERALRGNWELLDGVEAAGGR